MIQCACIEGQVFFPSVFSQGFLLLVSSMIDAACIVYRRSTLHAHCASVLCNIQTVRYTVSIPTGTRSTDFIVDLFVLSARALGAQRRSTVPVSRTHVAVVCVFASSVCVSAPAVVHAVPSGPPSAATSPSVDDTCTSLPRQRRPGGRTGWCRTEAAKHPWLRDPRCLEKFMFDALQIFAHAVLLHTCLLVAQRRYFLQGHRFFSPQRGTRVC